MAIKRSFLSYWVILQLLFVELPGDVCVLCVCVRHSCHDEDRQAPVLLRYSGLQLPLPWGWSVNQINTCVNEGLDVCASE